MVQPKLVRLSGEVFTKKDVVKYLLDEVDYTATNNLSKIKILEPSAGQGAFVLELIERLYQSSILHGFNFLTALNTNVCLVEKDINNFDILTKNVLNKIQLLGYDLNKVDKAIFINKDFLLLCFESNFHCIIGNPPYIRYDSIESNLRKIYKEKFQTFKNRADIYVAFYEKSLNLLMKDGLLSFICSNRWLFNQYGQNLRAMIAKKYHLMKLINIEKADVFDEEVIAYPCITTIENSNGKRNSTHFYESQEKEALLNSFHFQVLPSPTSDSWQNLFLTYDINNQALQNICSQGFNIGIGIATGADKIFIKKGIELEQLHIEKERLVPIVKSRHLKGEKISWNDDYVINPYQGDTLCDLTKYPNLNTYFQQNREILSKRYVAKKSPKVWYKTIDKLKPDLLKQNKLLLPDLAGCGFLFIDEGNYYPHHNIYYATHADLNSLKILACILMSDFIRNQLAQIGIRMNDGMPRFQIQALKKLRIPIFSKISNSDKEILIHSYDKRNLDAINKVINQYCHINGIHSEINDITSQVVPKSYIKDLEASKTIFKEPNKKLLSISKPPKAEISVC